MFNDRFLIILCVALASLIGAMLHTISLLRKDNKTLYNKVKFSEHFVNEVLNEIHSDGISVDKYVQVVMNKLTKKKGGEEDE